MSLKVHEVNVRSFFNPSKLADFVVNPYVGCPHKCRYCYAEFMKKFTHHSEPWGDFLDVKRCDRFPRPSSLRGKHVLISTVTDPYNPFEKRYGVTRQILEFLAECEDVHVGILTKSDLVLRDRDVLKKIAHVRIMFSMNSLDDTFRKIFEPHAISPERRRNALKTLHDDGFVTGIFQSPTFPELTDFRALIESVRDISNVFWFENLKLRTLYRTQVLNLVRIHYPELFPLYEYLFLHGGAEGYWAARQAEIEEYCQQRGIEPAIYFS
ncbi:MAG: radical SAM protein [Planctomycetia bacterium]|nr:radical SAM protein [Planctomycetia bacterium]